MTYTRPAPGDNGNDGSATDATVVVGALSDGLERAERAVINGAAWAATTMTTPPTLALSAASAATTISGSAVVAPNDSAYTYLGASMTNAGTLDGFTNCYHQSTSNMTSTAYFPYLLNVEFETDADTFEVIVRSRNTANGKIRVWVDGERATTSMVTVGTSGSYYRYKVTFSDSRARRIRIEGQYVTFYGVAKHPTRTMWATVRDTGPKAVIVGDSHLAGQDAAGGWSYWDSFGAVLGRYMGWNTYISAVPGTGYLATLGGSEPTYRSRFTTDVTNLSPEIVVFTGGLNDNATAAATVGAEISTLFSAASAALPNATFYVFDPFSPVDGYDSALNSIGAYLTTHAATYGFTKVSDCTGWITGTGYAGATNGSGNSDHYTASDAYHLSAAGYTYIGERMTGAIGTGVGRRAR